MCLGLPGRIVKITQEEPIRMGKVDFGGVIKEVCLSYIPEAQIGEYVIVHVGFAISKLDEDAAREMLESLEQLGELISRSSIRHPLTF